MQKFIVNEKYLFNHKGQETTEYIVIRRTDLSIWIMDTKDLKNIEMHQNGKCVLKFATHNDSKRRKIYIGVVGDLSYEYIKLSATILTLSSLYPVESTRVEERRKTEIKSRIGRHIAFGNRDEVPDIKG